MLCLDPRERAGPADGGEGSQPTQVDRGKRLPHLTLPLRRRNHGRRRVTGDHDH